MLEGNIPALELGVMDRTAGLTQALRWVQEARPLYTSLRSSGSIKNNIGGRKKKENEELN
jgi:hypothetical protein